MYNMNFVMSDHASFSCNKGVMLTESKETSKKEEEKKNDSGFGITEAPKEHPDNTTGKMKIIME